MLHRTINLPQMPQEFIDEILEIIKSDKNIAYATATIGPRTGQLLKIRGDHGYVTYPDGSKRRSAVYKRFIVPDHIHEWIKVNIDPNITNPKYDPANPTKPVVGKLGIQVFEHPYPGEILTYSPHVDGPRGHYILNYIISAGGSNVVTQWYQRGNEPVTRPEHGAGLFLKDLSNLKLVEETVFPTGSWALIDARPIHAIDNLETPRVSISIGYAIEDCPWQL